MNYSFTTARASGTASLPFNYAANEPRIYVTEDGYHIYKLPKAIEFDCMVDGKALKASLTHAEDDFTQYLYRVHFSDGYQAVFMVNPQIQQWVERGQNLPSPYASAISEDLFFINEFDILHPPFCLSVPVNGENVKVWAKKERACYGVFFKGDFRFFLHPFTGKWTTETIDHPKSYIINEIAAAVIQRLG